MARSPLIYRFKILLMGMVAVAIAASAYMSTIIDRQNVIIAQISNNNTAFIGSQAATELVRLRNRLGAFVAAPSMPRLSEIRLRYEIMIGRVAIMGSGEFGRFIRQSPYRDLLVDTLSRALSRAGEAIDGDLNSASAGRLNDDLEFFERPLVVIASAANQYAGQQVADAQRELTVLQQVSFFVTLVLVGCGTLLLLMVFRGNILLRRAHDGQKALMLELETISADLMTRNQQLDRMAHFDQLTGLANRALFSTELGKVVKQARKERNGFSVLLLDLDGFKAVNDTLGHYAGDELLKQVAGRIRSLVVADSLCARLGGDEFSIICRETSGSPGSSMLASQLVRQIGLPFIIEGRTVTIGVSVGFVGCDGKGSADVDDLIRRADDALYRAKRQGKGRSESAAEARAA